MSEHANLAAALVAALTTLTVIENNHTANAGSYTYKYADLGDVVKLTRPVLAEHGVVALTPVEEHGQGLKCTVVLLHTSGDRMDFGPFPFPHGRDAQATGSMVTYHRRYALVAALGMAVGEDDDGATAQPAMSSGALPASEDEAACRRCGVMVRGARSDKQPMRDHMVEHHDWIRNEDGTVAPPSEDHGGASTEAGNPEGVEGAPSSPEDAPAPAPVDVEGGGVAERPDPDPSGTSPAPHVANTVSEAKEALGGVLTERAKRMAEKTGENTPRPRERKDTA